MISATIETPRLVLSCLDAAHVTDAYRNWMSDPEVTRYLETRFAAPTVESLAEYVQAMRLSPDSYFFGMFSRSTGDHIGNIKLGPISPVHGSAAIGLILGDKTAWGKGFGSEAIGALADWAFGTLGLHKLTAGSYLSNTGSIRAFEKNGWSIEGVQRSHVQLADGGRDDVVILGITRADWAESR
jgi:[ribosomal protein S5]-alanine N-acetyltransferase